MTKEQIDEIAWKKYPRNSTRSCGFSYDANEESRKVYAECLEDVFIKKLYT